MNSFPVVEVPVHGNIEMDRGDLLFLDRVDGLRSKGLSTADWYGYPLSEVSGVTGTLDSNITLAGAHFLGIACDHSDSGVTQSLGVYTGGLFRYPLKNSRNSRVGYEIISTGSRVTLYTQKVAMTSSSGDRIAMVADSGEFRSTVDMVLISTVFNPS